VGSEMCIRDRDMAAGNGVGMMTINATHASFTWVSSVFSHNTQSSIKFSDSFVIMPQSNTTNYALLLEGSAVAAIFAVAVLTVLLVRRRTENPISQAPDSSQTRLLR